MEYFILDNGDIRGQLEYSEIDKVKNVIKQYNDNTVKIDIPFEIENHTITLVAPNEFETIGIKIHYKNKYIDHSEILCFDYEKDNINEDLERTIIYCIGITLVRWNFITLNKISPNGLNSLWED